MVARLVVHELVLVELLVVLLVELVVSLVVFWVPSVSVTMQISKMKRAAHILEKNCVVLWVLFVFGFAEWSDLWV